MSLVLVCPATGPAVARRLPQRAVAALLGGPVTFVGAIAACDAVLVARADAARDAPPNPHLAAAAAHLLDGAPPRGDVVVVASDAAGDEADLDVPAARAALGLG
jgi:hypothetical protein